MALPKHPLHPIMKKPKKLKPQIFILHLDIWNTDILVVVGVTLAKFKNYLIKIKLEDDKRNQMIASYTDFLEGNFGGEANQTVGEKGIPFYTIFLSEPEDIWRFYEIIIHETNHMTKFLMNYKGAQREIEANAYTQEAMFRLIRRKLQGVK